jgi:predicted phosphodiesterase
MQPGRACPLDYRYAPAVFQQADAPSARALIAAGGLYGNLSALDSIESIVLEHGRTRPDVATELIFNGDFHWFDAQADWFAQIEARTSKYIRLRGNVETEFERPDSGAGCGCDYPAGTDQGIVDRSNRIETVLAHVARDHRASLTGHAGWQGLPMWLVRTIAGKRVAVVHGDAWSLAGWRFAAGLSHQDLVALRQQSGIDVFVSSHTCEAVYLNTGPDACVVINNGSAGMPAFGRPLHGLVCRVADHPSQSERVVMQRQIGELFCEWLSTDCSAPAFRQRFLSRWPAGSDAHASYWNRIDGGTRLTLESSIQESPFEQSKQSS